jgi:hypothetical protein
MNTTSTSNTSYTRARLAAMTAFLAALTVGTVACGASEAGEENRAISANRSGNPASGWGPQVGDPLSPEGSERWGRPGYCPGSACVRTPGALLPAELRVP